MRKYTEREELELALWDAYKEAHGFRPRHLDFSTMSDDDIRKSIEKCCHIMAENDKLQNEEENLAIAKFEQAVSDKSLKMTRKEFVDSLMKKEECDDDIQYFCFLKGLPYNYDVYNGEKECNYLV